MPDSTEGVAAEPDIDLADPSSYGFWTRDVVRWSDLDALRHVNNTNFARYLEAGRIAALVAAAGGDVDAPQEFVLARLEIDYREEMHYPGDVEIGTRVLRLGRASIRFGQGVFQNDRCTCTGQGVLVRIDRNTRASVPLSESQRRALLEQGG
jgi:acyl-CoA thioester hydrolase